MYLQTPPDTIQQFYLDFPLTHDASSHLRTVVTLARNNISSSLLMSLPTRRIAPPTPTIEAHEFAVDVDVLFNLYTRFFTQTEMYVHVVCLTQCKHFRS
jgi:hypothetical protein